MPSARLLETSPKGWQSTGSYEDRNYSKLQQSIQRQDYCPILDFHYRLLAKSEFDLDKHYVTNFDPIDTPTEKERAEIKELNSRTDMNYVNAGVISPDEVRSVLREDINSGYNTLSEEMEGEPVENDPFADLLGGSGFADGRSEASPDSEQIEPACAQHKVRNSVSVEQIQDSENSTNFFSSDEWEESKHPRKENGQFGEGGSSGKVEKSQRSDKIRKRTRKEVQLPKDEYARVMSELNTNLTKEQRKKKSITKAIGNHIYKIENKGFNSYRIVSKKEI